MVALNKIMYTALKHSHQMLAILSLMGFIIRGIWMMKGSPLLQAKLTKILPHVIDTFLLITAIWLTTIISQYPITHHWLTAKVVALVMYIVFGLFALKKAKTKSTRIGFFVAALACFGYILVVAKTHSPVLNLI